MKIFNKKIIGVGIVCIGLMFSLTGCFSTDNTPTADQKQTQATNQAMDQANQQVGMPNITNFTERKQLKEIYELRDQSNLICYAYVQNQMDGKFIYLGECQGYGLPYDTEYTNPDQIVQDGGEYGGGNVAIPQEDPNMLYQGDSNATWLIMIDAKTGKDNIMYAEPNTVVYQAKLAANLCEAWSLPTNY
jgi:hypothetical protein